MLADPEAQGWRRSCGHPPRSHREGSDRGLWTDCPLGVVDI
jgi:hypothetical protein